MKILISLLAAASIGAAIPAVAQVDSQSKDVNAQVLAQTNGAEANQAQQQNTMNAEQQAQYQTDMAAYRQAMREHRRTQIADAARYDRQQRAYAQAMFDWRVQAAACQNGNTAACNLPAPDPTKY